MGVVAGADVGETTGADGVVGVPSDSEDLLQLQLFESIKNGNTIATIPKQMMMRIPTMMTAKRREAVRGSTVGGGAALRLLSLTLRLLLGRPLYEPFEDIISKQDLRTMLRGSW